MAQSSSYGSVDDILSQFLRDERKPQRNIAPKLRDDHPLQLAQEEFEEHLECHTNHYARLDPKICPLLRSDELTGLNPKQLQRRREEHTWDDSTKTWTKDGKRCVHKEKIYAILLGHQLLLETPSRDSLWDQIKDHSIQGILEKDVREANRLWKEHGLHDLDLYHDALGRGPPASIGGLTVKEIDNFIDGSLPVSSDGKPYWLRPRMIRPLSPKHSLQNDETGLDDVEESSQLQQIATDALSRTQPKKRQSATSSQVYKRHRSQYSNTTENPAPISRPPYSFEIPKRGTSPSEAPCINAQAQGLPSSGSQHVPIRLASRETPSDKRGSHQEQLGAALSGYPPDLSRSSPTTAREEATTATALALGLPRHVVTSTNLRVKAHNRAECTRRNLNLRHCPTSALLFTKIADIIGSDVLGEAEVEEVSAIYPWRDGLTISRGEQDDWEAFIGDIRQAWEDRNDEYARRGCKIRMTVEVDT